MHLRSLLTYLIAAFVGLLCHGAEWKTAEPGWTYAFPRDHWPHEEFKTEWWYFTGQLTTADGRRFGYQLTFFRQGVRPLADRGGESSRFIVNNLAFAHAALTDVGTGRFRFAQKLNRGAFGEAGFGSSAAPDQRVAWIETWSLALDPNGNFTAQADVEGSLLTLHFAPAKPWIFHGTNGISQKAAGEGHASHYYSSPRLETTGTLTTHGKSVAVTGESWLDREWATNQLTEEQAGWDWFSLQFADGTELMLYQMRLRNGGIDPHSSGTFVDINGITTTLDRNDYELQPTRFWTSTETGARYPIGWHLRIPKLDLTAEVTTPVPAQELVLKPIAYWEGLVEASGSRSGQPLHGHGYLELTGYSGKLVGITAESAISPRK